MSEDLEEFFQQMSDVVRHQSAEKVQLVKEKKDASVDLRRLNAGAIKDPNKNELSGEPMNMVQPDDVLQFKREGIGHQVFKRFRLGQYPIEARLDLHRKTVAEAREEVFGFVKDCMKYNIRTALILHGKAPNGEIKAMLKSCVNQWLPEIDDVMAFHSAQSHHGGTGAVYVMMRKSEEKKLENRLKFNKGRI